MCESSTTTTTSIVVVVNTKGLGQELKQGQRGPPLYFDIIQQVRDTGIHLNVDEEQMEDHTRK